MTLRQPRYSKEEFARRGDEIYNRDIRPQVEAGNRGKFIAIDIETGEWEIDTDALAACDRLNARIPASQTWLVRIGTPMCIALVGRAAFWSRDDYRHCHWGPRGDYPPGSAGDRW